MDTQPLDRPASAETASSSRGMSTPALELVGVSHRYGPLVAVRELSLSVAPGEIVCLVGPSGCGKSTLLRLAAGLEDLQTGEVRIAGSNRRRPPRHGAAGEARCRAGVSGLCVVSPPDRA